MNSRPTPSWNKIQDGVSFLYQLLVQKDFLFRRHQTTGISHMLQYLLSHGLAGPFLRRHRASPPERVDMAILAFHVRKINTFPVRGRPERDRRSGRTKGRNRIRSRSRLGPRGFGGLPPADCVDEGMGSKGSMSLMSAYAKGAYVQINRSLAQATRSTIRGRGTCPSQACVRVPHIGGRVRLAVPTRHG